MTEKQKKLIKIISGNIKKTGFTKTMTAMMLEAGYSPSMADRQVSTLKSIRDKTEPIVQAVLEERDAAIKAMKGKRKNAKYRELGEAAERLTKVAQLLGGKPTEIIKVDDVDLNNFITWRKTQK